MGNEEVDQGGTVGGLAVEAEMSANKDGTADGGPLQSLEFIVRG